MPAKHHGVGKIYGDWTMHRGGMPMQDNGVVLPVHKNSPRKASKPSRAAHMDYRQGVPGDAIMPERHPCQKPGLR